jgi:hypothetical protein
VPLVSSVWMQPVLEVILRRSALHNPVVHLLFGSIPNVRPVAELRLNESLFQHKPKLGDQMRTILQATRLPLQARIIFFCGRPFRPGRCVDQRE